ncbi:MAG: dihydroorotate dehydrogenase electron transfer subunit [Anaerolineae bacterium]|nr:dihydroorotate dehydrogenase electron transfer subunit [Anaerolineae bacterium]
MIPQMSRITRVLFENRSVATFELDACVDAEPGQFLMVWLPGEGEKPISIMDPDPLTITVARVGPFSTALHQRQVGDAVGWRGPFGRPFTVDGRHLLLVAGGYGAAPLHFLARRACDAGISTTLALGARTGDDLILVDRFRAIGCTTVLATDRGDVGYQGFVTDAILPDLAQFDRVAACGPEAMLYAVARMCWDAGVPAEVSLERYMKCGFGICGQCAMGDKLVCKDGPVFDIEELRHNRDFARFTRTATGRRVSL